MKWETITVSVTGDTLLKGVHETGLPIYVFPKADYTSTYAVIATAYGSIDNAFEVDGRQVQVPAGIAHYLEHKLFESEDGDAFSRYAETGASANAYTSFGQTAYLFSCTDRLEESLHILLDFVQHPYFTEETVRKERGIIGQEIRMCEDSPERDAMFRVLNMLYPVHPVGVEIAGTVESIEEITPALLYDCYHTFYNLRNMVLVLSGNVNTALVERVADEMLKPSAPFTLTKQIPEDMTSPENHRSERAMPVSCPCFHIGIKEPVAADYVHSSEEMMAAELFLELLCGRGSVLYSRLMAEGLINESFDSGYFEGRGYAAYLFSGESRDPDAVLDAVLQEIERFRCEGVDEERFIEERNALYGRLIAGLNDVENCGDWIVDDHLYGRKPFELIDSIATLDVKSVYRILEQALDMAHTAMAVVTPIVRS